MKVLVIQQKMIGDVLTCSILCEEIKKKKPTYEVSYLVNSNTVPVLENNPYIDKLVVFTPEYRNSKLKLLKFLLEIRKNKYDIIIDAYSKLESNLITIFSGTKIKISYSKHYSKFIYNNSLIQKNKTFTNAGLAIERRLQLIEALNINSDFKTFPQLYITKEEKEKSIKLLKQHNVDSTKKNIMISIIGSSENKTYPLKYMSTVVDYIANAQDCNIFFNYIPNQIEDAKIVFKNCSNSTKKKIYFDVLGKNLREFIALVDQCDYIIGNDGGAINMAKALNKPSFIIFSPWIEKNVWATFEDGLFHKTVHLKDYKPKLFKNKKEAFLKNNSIKIYQSFKPELIKNELNTYLSRLKKENLTNYTIEDSLIKKNNKPITALVITYNEEKHIEDLIENLSFTDEIIIVDSNSNDKTIEKIKKYKHVKLITNNFKNFSEQRNFALSKATNDWVLFLDADERVTPNLKQEIIEAANNKTDIVAFEMYRKFFFKKKLVRFSGWQTDKVFRLYNKNNISYKKELLVHELIDVNGKQAILKNKLLHYSFETYNEYKSKMKQYATLRAKELHLKELKPNFYHYYIKPLYRFLNHFIIRLGFLDGKKGFTVSYLGAYYVYRRYVELNKIYKSES